MELVSPQLQGKLAVLVYWYKHVMVHSAECHKWLGWIRLSGVAGVDAGCIYKGQRLDV